MPDELENHKMTLDRLGERVSDFSGDLAMVKAKMGTMETSFRDGMREVKDAIHSLSSHDSSRHAVKGMIPVTYVTWGIGAVISFFSVLLVVVAMAAGVVVFAMKSGDGVAEIKIGSMRDRMIEDDEREKRDRRQFETLVAAMADHATAQAGVVANQEGRIKENETELSVFWDWYHPFLQGYGKLEAKVDNLWSEVQSHTSNLDHPGRQTYEIESLKSRANQIDGIIRERHLE